MRVHRLISRFDYQFVPLVMDRAGHIIELMRQTHSAGFFETFRDMREERRVMAVKAAAEGASSTMLSVDPKTMWFSMESIEGWAPNQLDQSIEVRSLFNTIDKIREEFEIRHFLRAGLRQYIYSRPLETFALVANSYRSSFSHPVRSVIEQSMGPITDYSWVFDGDNEDALSYKMRSGPYQSSEASRYMQETAESFSEIDAYTAIIDIDIFEQKFEPPIGNCWKWAKSIFARSTDVATKVDELIPSLHLAKKERK